MDTEIRRLMKPAVASIAFIVLTGAALVRMRPTVSTPVALSKKGCAASQV
jgi:hypothetical protein